MISVVVKGPVLCYKGRTLHQYSERELQADTTTNPERCPSWLKGHDWKSCVRPKGVPRVRIPLSPPCDSRVLRNEKVMNPVRSGRKQR